MKWRSMSRCQHSLAAADADVVTEAELMSLVQQRDVTDVSFDSLQQTGESSHGRTRTSSHTCCYGCPA